MKNHEKVLSKMANYSVQNFEIENITYILHELELFQILYLGK